jgi:putative lipoic acid-binding regulatory protein
MSEKEEFYSKLEKQLDEHHNFPSTYMFKFIIPNDNRSIALVEELFTPKAVVTFRESKTGKYVSVTGKDKFNNAENVIATYKLAEKIEGLMSL